MGKYLHLFLGESAKTEHDEIYNDESGYTEPWAAFVENYGMTYNKVEIPTEFSICDYPVYSVDWSQIEEFYFKEMPSTGDMRLSKRGFRICDAAVMYYDETESTWFLCVYGDKNEDCTAVSTVEQINEIINQSPIIDDLRTNGPYFNCPCQLCARPVEGYWPPEPTRRTFASMTQSDWDSYISALNHGSEYVSIHNAVDEVEIFNEFIASGAECVDILVSHTFYREGNLEEIGGYRTSYSLYSWDGTKYSIWYDVTEKDGEPHDVITGETNFITDSFIRNSGSEAKNMRIEWTVPSEVKQAFEDNIMIAWCPSD